MSVVDALLERKLASLTLPLALRLPGGHRVGREDAAVTLHLNDAGTLAHIASGEVGRVAQDYVEGRLEVSGSLRDLMAIAAEMVGDDPTRDPGSGAPRSWWREIRARARSRNQHRPQADAQQVQFHYDVSDDFYALWLDPQRVYSCAYFRDADMTLPQAQQAKLDHICRKLVLREGDRLLDIGAGWGALLMWAAQHYGVQAHGVTLSRNQHAHVSRLIEANGLRGRVSIALCDYRELDEAQPFDRIASVGMFEHVGRAQLPAYFAKIARLLKPGGLLMNHGITAGGTHNHQLGAGMGDFIERYIFPGGELQHISRVLEAMSDAGFEPLDAENLRPHYARTLWAWSDALEARLVAARELTSERVLRAYRMYLAGSAMGFEQGWMGLYQVLAARPGGSSAEEPMRGAQSTYPFQRGYMYAWGTTLGSLSEGFAMLYKFKSKAAGDVIMMGPAGDDVLRRIGKAPAAQGIIEPAAMAAAITALERAVADDEAARAQAEADARAEGRKVGPSESVTLRQRAWPLVEMMKRSAAEGADIVWGV